MEGMTPFYISLYTHHYLCPMEMVTGFLSQGGLHLFLVSGKVPSQVRGKGVKKKKKKNPIGIQADFLFYRIKVINLYPGFFETLNSRMEQYR